MNALQPLHRTPPPAQAAPPAWSVVPAGVQDESLLGRTVDDMLNLSQLMAAGKLYKMGHQAALASEQADPPLQSVPQAALNRPFFIVPGWTTKPEKFTALLDKLTAGGLNGGRAYYVKDGVIYDDPDTTRPLPENRVPGDARVFVGVFHDRLQPPDVTADQIGRSLGAIRRVSGTDRVDVEGYSMGGLAVRVYLDRGGQDVGKLLLLGAPNRGSRFAELSRRVIHRDIQWAMGLAGLTVADLPAMDWMALDDDAGRSNPRLHDLNTRWDDQRNRTEGVLVVGSQELATPAKGLVPMKGGDGLVAADRLALPGADLKVLKGRATLQHGHLPTDPGVYLERKAFFGWADAGGSAPSAP